MDDKWAKNLHLEDLVAILDAILKIRLFALSDRVTKPT